jgi:hypothetical protein
MSPPVDRHFKEAPDDAQRRLIHDHYDYND